MMNSGNPKPLLDRIFELSGCSYLSDLHDPRNAKTVSSAMESINRSDYSPDEWAEAIEYISGKDRATLPGFRKP